MENGVKRIRACLPTFHPINDYRHVLKLCANDYVMRVPGIEHKIKVVETNLDLVPFLASGLVCMKNELVEVKERINQINNLLENNRLNNPIE